MEGSIKFSNKWSNRCAHGFKVLQSHPRSNGKFGTTGHSRGGTNSFFLADVKLTSKFLGGTKGFDAILPEAAECRMAGFFAEPELTSNTTILVVHGGAMITLWQSFAGTRREN